jgi:Fe-S-cluster containining protein
MPNIQNMDPAGCRRCGTCCRKGGPALHGVDLDSVRGGAIPLSCLYTIRPGEVVTDNVCGGLSVADADIIKIKSKTDGVACVFFDQVDDSCRRYADRPLECREMACWDTEAIRGVYAWDRLDRGRIIEKIPALAELVAMHEAECNMGLIARLVDLRKNGDTHAAADIAGRISYDADLRKRAMSAQPGVAAILDFLFGRPLCLIIPLQFGVPVRRSPQA